MKAKAPVSFMVLVFLFANWILNNGCCSTDKIINHEWVLEQYGPKNNLINILPESHIQPPAMTKILLKLKEDNSFSGNDGCNLFFGTYETTRCKIKFDSIRTTLKMCQENVMGQARAISSIFVNAEKYKVSNTHLRLYTSDDQVLSYVKQD